VDTLQLLPLLLFVWEQCRCWV